MRITAIALESIGICAIIGAIAVEAIIKAEAQAIMMIATAGAGTIALGSMLYAKVFRYNKNR